MPEMLLRDSFLEPTETVLKDMLGEIFSVYETLVNQTPDLAYDRKYYKDSKGWLCKVSYKKKTVFWLSIWEGFFKTSFFFLERHMNGIKALEVDENSFVIEKERGKMIPLIFDIHDKKQLPNVLKIIEFKKNSK